MMEIYEYLKARYVGEKAQGIVEYALILAFVVAIAGVALSTSTSTGLGGAINTAFQKVSNAITNFEFAK